MKEFVCNSSGCDSLQIWKKILEFSPFAIAITSQQTGEILFASPAFSGLLGFEVLGTRPQDWTHPDDMFSDLKQQEALRRGDLDNYSAVKRFQHERGHWLSVLLEVGVVRELDILLIYVTNISGQVRQQEVLALNAEVALGILKRQFEVWYQPIVLLESGETVGYEALLRWRKDGTIIPPARFLQDLGPGTLATLTLEVLRIVLNDVPALDPYWVGVNLDARNLSRQAFVDKIDEMIAQSGVGSQMVRFEVTEQYFLEAPIGILALQQWQDKGHVIEVDDVGVASTLAAIAHYPATVLKIDMSLTRGIVGDRNTQRLFRLILSFAESLDYEVIVEGVETPEQANWLRYNGFRYGQGYQFSEPKPLPELKNLS